MIAVLCVAFGGALGALVRYSVSELGVRWQRHPDKPQIPWATFVVNVAGAFLLGFFTRILVNGADTSPSWLLLIVGTGFCGALTTMSTFAFEIVMLLRRGAAVEAVGYLMITLGSIMAAMWLGLFLPVLWTR
ncbi:fluoride efflux transporter CrcB [Devriesea agamarum]|uniref:fluoride efflux transporter CrcB n=1 Tax=Devriesea agamarum TaxID=472569 RepID=UPI00071D7DD3|nr:fluoride efflux transporter CrcB [Devriesea agamarum]